MENVLNVEARPDSGKGAARKLRARGRIPGVIYGHQEKAVPFSVDPTPLRRTIHASGFGRNTVLKIEGLERTVLALLHDTQVDPVKRNLLHIDLLEVREDEKVTVSVPVELSGRAKGVVLGGTLQQLRRQVDVKCTPLTIPKKIVMDVREMNLNQTYHVSDLPFPEGTSPVSSEKLAIATLVAPAGAEEGGETAA
jgi:large subunit ribosomal protein L25